MLRSGRSPAQIIDDRSVIHRRQGLLRHVVLAAVRAAVAVALSVVSAPVAAASVTTDAKAAPVVALAERPSSEQPGPR
jgi:hypothetical protein